MFQLATSSAIRACEILLNEDGQAYDEVIAAQQTTEIENDADAGGKTFPRSFVRFSEAVTMADMRVGQALRKGLLRIAEKSPNAYWRICRILLESLIPSMFYYALQRSGHFDVAEKPLFRNLPDWMCTRRLNYQELLLVYVYIKSIMPPSLYHSLYTNVPGSLAINLSTNGMKHSPLHIDECLECTIIRNTKGIKTKDSKTISESVAWSQQMRKAVQKLCKELRPSLSPDGVRNAEESDDFGLRLTYDRDKCVASNVSAMLNEMRRAGHLDTDHLNASDMRNAFTNDALSTEVAGNAIKTRETGFHVAGLFLSNRLKKAFGPLTQEEVMTYFDGKLPLVRFTSRFAEPKFYDICSARSGSANPHTKKRRARAGVQIHSKRAKAIHNFKDRLLGILPPEEACDAYSTSLKAEVRNVIDCCRGNAYVKTVRSQAYRELLDGELPYHGSK